MRHRIPRYPAPPSYYVATNGNDAWTGLLASPNGGATDGPFRTITQAQTATHSGGIKRLTIRAGTYTLAANLTFTASDQGCYWVAYQNEKPVIDGNANSFIVTSSGITGNAVTGSPGLTIKGLTFNHLGVNVNDGFVASIVLRGSGYAFRWNTVLNVLNAYGINGNWSNSLIDSNTFNGQSPGDFANGAFSCINGQAGGSNNSSGNQVSHNLIQNAAAGGISFESGAADSACSNNIIDRNLLINVCNSVSDDGPLYIMDRTHTQVGNKITNNVVAGFGTASGVATGTQAIYLDDSASHVEVTGNVIYGIIPLTGGGSHAVQYHGGDFNNVHHNIFVIPPGEQVGFNQSGTQGVVSTMTNNLFQHNIVYFTAGTPNPPWQSAGSPPNPPTISNNLYFSGNGSAFQNVSPYVDASPVLADPQFVNAAANDFRLQPTSPAYAQLGWTTLPTDQGPLAYQPG